MLAVNFDFTNSNFVVTGATSGMGRQITQELIAAGANVLCTGRNEERLAQCKSLCGERVMTASLDVCDKEKMEAAIKNFTKSFGKVAGCVHAAGIDGMTLLKFHDADLVQRIMDISYGAAVNILEILQKKKYSEDGASFVFFSSVAAIKGEKGMFAYSAAKAAVNALVKTAAKELSGRGIRVNSICPGRVQTPMTEGKPNEEVVSRHLLGEGKPEDISGVVMFLLSARAGWITGTNIIVDGGYTIG